MVKMRQFPGPGNCLIFTISPNFSRADLTPRTPALTSVGPCFMHGFRGLDSVSARWVPPSVAADLCVGPF